MKRSDWLPAAACFAGILLLSSIPPSGILSDPFFGLDKIAHLLIYGIFGCYLHRLRWSFASLMLLGAALAACDEAYQHFVSGRTAEWGDWFADLIGMALGLLISRARSPRS